MHGVGAEARGYKGIVFVPCCPFPVESCARLGCSLCRVGRMDTTH